MQGFWAPAGSETYPIRIRIVDEGFFLRSVSSSRHSEHERMVNNMND